jgi:ABC-type nitrate/sulfonate/bicarbonate transport system substrate-binding protein
MLIGVFVSLLLALFTSAFAQSSKPQQLRLAVSTATPHNTPLWVAKDKKIFDKYGVDVQLIFVMGGALVTQMLAAGEIQIAANAPAALLGLVAGGELRCSSASAIPRPSPWSANRASKPPPI